MFTKYKRLRKTLKYLLTKFIQEDQKRIMPQTRHRFIILMTFGVYIISISKIVVLKTIEIVDMFQLS